MLEQDLATFVSALGQATAAVPLDYFQVPVAAKETPLYRERVYCYELYHRLRLALPASFAYSLAGEVDKSGYPLFRDPSLNRCKPDFLIHSFGNMERNLLAIEVKPCNVRAKPIRKDLATLAAFLDHADYEYAIFLVYGQAANGLRWKPLLRRVAQGDGVMPHLNGRLLVYWHEAVGAPAVAVPWLEIMREKVKGQVL